MSKNPTKKLKTNPKRNDLLIAQILSNLSSNIYVGFGLIIIFLIQYCCSLFFFYFPRSFGNNKLI